MSLRTEAAFSLATRQRCLEAFSNYRFDEAHRYLDGILGAPATTYLSREDMDHLKGVRDVSRTGSLWMSMRYDHKDLEHHPLHNIFVKHQAGPSRAIVESLQADANLLLEYAVDEYWRLCVLSEHPEARREVLIGLVGLAELIVDGLLLVSSGNLKLNGAHNATEAMPVLSRNRGLQNKKVRLLWGHEVEFSHDGQDEDSGTWHRLQLDPPVINCDEGDTWKAIWKENWGKYPYGDWQERHALVHERAPLSSETGLTSVRDSYLPRFIELLYRRSQAVEPINVSTSNSSEWLTWRKKQDLDRQARLPWAQDAAQVPTWLRLTL